MEDYKELKSKLCVGKFWIITSAICALVCALCILGAVLTARNDENVEIPYYESGMLEGTVCKLDIVKIDDSFAVDEGTGNEYFLCMASDGYLYVVKMERSLFESAFGGVYSYTLAPNASASESVTFSGTLTAMTAELTQLGASYWGRSDFTEYVGAMYIDGTLENRNYLPLILSICAALSAVVALFAGYVFIKRKSASSKCLKTIFNTGASRRALEELNDKTSAVYGKGDVVMGKYYMFLPKMGLVYLYSDILWCYAKRTKLYFFAVSKNLVVHDIYGNAVNTLIEKASASTAEEVINAIYLNNPDCILGYSEKNKENYNNSLRRLKVEA